MRSLQFSLVPLVLFVCVTAVSAQTAADYLQQADIALSQKNYERALESYTVAIQLDPHLAEAYAGRGTAYATELRYLSAISDFTQAIALDPKNATYYAYKASLLHDLLADKYALTCIDTAILLAPKFASAYSVRGRIETSLGDTVAARADIEHALQLEPKLVQAMIDMAMLHVAETLFVRASNDLSRALAMEPDNDQAMMARALIAIAKGDFEMAKYDLTGLITKDSLPVLIELRAQADLELGDTVGTMSDLELATHGRYLSPKGYWTRAKLRKALHDTTGALEDYSMTLSLAPAYDDPRLGLANLQIDLHEYRAAQSTLTQGIVIDSTVPDFWYHRARAREGLGDTNGAIEDYRATVERSHGYSEAYEGLGRIYVDRGDAKKALMYLTTAVEVDSSAHTFHQRAFVYEALHQFAEAIPDEERALALDSTFVSAYINLGWCYQSIHQDDSAIQIFRHGQRFDGANALLLMDLGRSETVLHHYQDALKHFDEAIRLNSDNSESYKERGDLHWQRQEYEAAINDYDEALRIDPKDAKALSNRSYVELMSGDTSHAMKDIQRALRLAPEDDDVLVQAGIVEHARKNNNVALGYLRHALAIEPANANAWAFLGDVYEALKRNDSSIGAYSKAIQLNPECASNYANRGVIYLDTHDTANAIKDLRKVEELHDSASIAYVLPILVAMGHSSPAQTHVSGDGASTATHDVNVFIIRGNIANSAKHYEEAIANYRHVLDLDPMRSEVFNFLGFAYQVLGNFDSSYYFYDKEVQAFPENPIGYDGRGMALSALRRCTEALPDFTQAIELGDTTFYPRLNRAIAEIYLHQYDAARDDIERAHTRDASDERVHKIRMQVYDLLHQYSTLITVARETQAAFPDLPEASYELVVGLCNTGAIEQALTEAKHLLVLRHDVKSAGLTGSMFWRMKNWDSARYYYSMALRLKPGDSLSLFSRGSLFLNQMMLNESIQDMNQLLYLHPDCPAAYAIRAEAEFAHGDRIKAIEDAHIALRNPEKLDPKLKEFLETNVK